MQNDHPWINLLMHYCHDHYSEMMPVIFFICIVGIIFGVIREMRWLSVFLRFL
ncbi:hypothetical protein PROPEN_02283 [Proteus penneri ATCC 35198]|nr:hypothetical protein PROPEN_02283 [Proteus penneri ATCC 35198]